MIFWCLYAFVAAGFEHSVANMTLLTLALLQPHSAAVSVVGMGYNLLWVTIGNIIGGAVFVGGAYWVANRGLQTTTAAEAQLNTSLVDQPAYAGSAAPGSGQASAH
jgi:formate/nitrite transporter FocA (FNT family)